MEPSELVARAAGIVDGRPDLTHKGFAEEVGISTRSWRRWRRGSRTPSGESLRSLTEWVEGHTEEAYGGPSDAEEDPYLVAANELELADGGGEADASELTRREEYIVHKLRTSTTVEALAEDLGIRPSMVGAHLRNLRERGFEVYADEESETVGIENAGTLRSSEDIGQRTRKANQWWQKRHDALVRQFRGLDVPDTEMPAKKGREDWVIHLTDIHAGDFVRDQTGEVVYSTDQIPAVLDYITDKAIGLAKHHDAEYDTCHLLWGGDLVTSEGIYEGQHEDIDAYLDKQVETLREPLYRQIKRLATAFDTLNIVAKSGNHGEQRASGKSKQANSDLILYKDVRHTVATLQQEAGMLENVRFRIGEAKNYRSFPLRGGKLKGHLRHGQHRRPQAETSARKKEWLSTLQQHDFDVAYMGHYHISGLVPWDGPPIVVTGSPKPAGEFVERIGEGVPSEYQTMASCHGITDKGMTAFYPIDSRDF